MRWEGGRCKEQANRLSVRQDLQARGYVAPESLTQGSSEQRMAWFRRGLESGELSACDTFKSGRP
jgi:predicted metalloprotease